MKPRICYDCGKQLKHGTEYSWVNEELGSFTIPCSTNEYSFCDCGNEYLAYSLCLRIEKAEQERRNEISNCD